MPETILFFNKGVLISKVITASVVGRVNVNNIDLSLMGFLQQPQGVEIIALQDEVIALTGCRSDFPLRNFREHRNIIPHHHIHGFLMLLPDKAILLGGQLTLNLAQGDEHIVIVPVLVLYLLQER